MIRRLNILRETAPTKRRAPKRSFFSQVGGRRFVGAVFSFVSLCSTPANAGSTLPLPHEWEQLKTVPRPTGFEVERTVVSNGVLLAFGRSLPGGFSIPAVRVFDLEDGDGWETPKSETQLESVPCGAVTAGEHAVYCVGGNAKSGANRDVVSIGYNRDSQSIEVRNLPPLPEARSLAGAVVHKDALYVAGGLKGTEGDTPAPDLWKLDLSDNAKSSRWENLSNLPGTGVVSPILVVQDHGDGDAVYLFDRAGNRLLEYNLSVHGWRPRSPPIETIGASAISVGTAHIFAVPAPDEEELNSYLGTRREQEFLAYHTITDTWVATSPVEIHGRPIAANVEADAIYVISADPIGVLSITRGTLPEIASHFRTFDYGVLFVYFAVLIYMGHWFSKREKSTDDYFRGGKRVPGWAAGISIIGTKFSAVSFMSIPAKTFATNWTYLAMQVSILVAAVVVIRYFIPFFCNLDVTTAYEYLERRFNVFIRLIGSVKFVLFEIFRMGILVLLPSIVLSVITGIDIYLCVLIIGVVSTVYTILGGIEAVIWTDVIQVFIMVGGTIFGIIYALLNVDAGAFAAMSRAADAGKTQVFDFDFTLTAATVWVLVLSLPAAANNYVSNQTIVQRFISTKDVKQAARSMWITALVGPSIIFLFFFMGTALYLFYQSNPAQLNVAMQQPDEVLAWYIVRELPVGISGLLVGAIFAATMSSLDSALSSTSTVFVSDIYRRFKPGVPDHQILRLAKILTAVLGVLGTGSALLLVALEIKSLFDEFMKIMGLLGGGLAGIFILGTMTRRTHSVGVLVGFVVSIFVLWYTKVFTDLHFFLYGAVGMGTCVVVGYVSSLIIPVNQKSLLGLTIHTTKE